MVRYPAPAAIGTCRSSARTAADAGGQAPLPRTRHPCAKRSPRSSSSTSCCMQKAWFCLRRGSLQSTRPQNWSQTHCLSPEVSPSSSPSWRSPLRKRTKTDTSNQNKEMDSAVSDPASRSSRTERSGTFRMEQGSALQADGHQAGVLTITGLPWPKT